MTEEVNDQEAKKVECSHCNKRYYEESCEVVESGYVNDHVFTVIFKSESIVKSIKPGQFINIQAGKDLTSIPVLRRPFAVSHMDLEKSEFEVIFHVKGKGTKILAEILVPGYKANILGPLGNGFDVTPNENKKLLIAGGLGIAPLKILLQHFLQEGKDVTLIWGNKTKRDFFDIDFYLDQDLKLFVATDNGSYGFEGNALDMLKTELLSKKISKLKQYDIYVVGPEPMMKAVADFVKEQGLRCQVSLETSMACGFGVCQGCAVETPDKNEFKLVCKDGPVFWSDEVII